MTRVSQASRIRWSLQALAGATLALSTAGCAPGARDLGASAGPDPERDAEAGAEPVPSAVADAAIPAAGDDGGTAAGSTPPEPPRGTPTISMTTRLGSLAGPFYRAAPGQSEIGFFGTDLGVSFEHAGEIRIIFGDTWQDEIGTPTNGTLDDSQARISMAALPNGNAVDTFIAATDQSSLPVWGRAVPPIEFELNDAGRVAPVELYRDGDSGQAPVDLGLGKAVMAAFSNGRDGAFALFRRDVAVPCSGGEQPSCDLGFVCDEAMGFCSNTAGEYPMACVVGTSRCGLGVCVVPPGGGLCQDRSSSMYGDGDEDGRLESLVIEHEFGNADPERATRYFTVPWRTNKFTNPIMKRVRDFDPGREDPNDNDYRLVDGTGEPGEHVLIWGRPHSVGTGAVGRDARLYFAYSKVPEYSEQGPQGFEPKYLAALDDGRPSFSPNPADAMALDLGGQPLPESERYDVVDRTAVTYLPSMRRWVMLYGGDFAPAVLRVFVGPSFPLVERAPTGAIYARFAEHPWGPWSEPVPVLEAGDPGVAASELSLEYAAGGILHHNGCVASDCAPGAPAWIFLAAPNGFLYAPNIFDTLTEVREQGQAVDIYWNVSTWNPYQVILLRTRLRMGP